MATWFWSNLTAMARKVLEDSSEPPEEGAREFDIRTKALTRPAYTTAAGLPANRPGVGLSKTPRSARSSARGQASGRSSTASDSARRVASGEDLFGGTRESAVPAAVYVRFQKSQENRAKAEQARAERVERDGKRAEMARQQYEETQEIRNRMRGRNEAAKIELVERNLEIGEVVREERADIERTIEMRRIQLKEDHKAKYVLDGGGFGNRNARLAAEEEHMDEMERQAAQEDRRNRRQYAHAYKKQQAEENRALVEMRRMQNAERLAFAFAERQRLRNEGAQEMRDDSAMKLGRFEMEEEERKAKVAATRDRIQEHHRVAMENREKRRIQRQKFHHKAEVRDQAYRHEEEAKLMAQNRAIRNAIFGGRYVSKEAATEFDSSAFRKLFSMDDTADAQIAEANLEMLARIENVELRTDADVNDDAAGLARIEFAKASEERKAREQEEMSKANAEMRERIKNTKPAVDDLMDDEAAAVRRAEMAAEAEARRAQKASIAAEKNEALKQRLANVKAATDNDVSDDEVGAARKAAAAAAAERKRVEAERIARENEALRQRLANIKAVTDDDVNDDEGGAIGAARAKMAAQSKANRRAQSEQLARTNAAARARLRQVKAVVDDDISDDAAGMARAGYDLHHREGNEYSS